MNNFALADENGFSSFLSRLLFSRDKPFEVGESIYEYNSLDDKVYKTGKKVVLVDYNKIKALYESKLEEIIKKNIKMDMVNKLAPKEINDMYYEPLIMTKSLLAKEYQVLKITHNYAQLYSYSNKIHYKIVRSKNNEIHVKFEKYSGSEDLIGGNEYNYLVLIAEILDSYYLGKGEENVKFIKKI